MSQKLKTFLNHERYQVLAVFGILILLLWFFGCQSLVSSLLDPEIKVTRQQLQIEVDHMIAQADLRFKQLDSEDQFRKQLVDQFLLWSKAGTINPVGVLMSIVTLAGAGATVDNVRRRKAEKSNK